MMDCVVQRRRTHVHTFTDKIMIFKKENKRRRLTISIFTLNKSTVDGLIWKMTMEVNQKTK